MLNNAWTIFRINGAIRGNKLIYWLGRIPLIRRLFTDRLYAAGEGKFALFLLQNLWWALKAIAGKVLYLAVLLLIAALTLDGPQQTLSPENFGPFLWLFLWFSFLVGTMLQPHAVAPLQLKYICVRMMAMDAWRYQMIAGLGHHLAAFAGFTPLLMGVTALLGAGPWAGLAVSVELALVRLAAEGFHLAVYSRTGVSIGNKTWYIILLTVVGMAGAFACLLAVVVMLSIRWVGTLMLNAMLVLPAAAARNLARNVRHYHLLSVLLALVCSVVGLLLSFAWGTASGAS